MLIGGRVEKMLRALQDQLDEADAVVFTPLAFGLHHLAQLRNIPSFALYFQPFFPTAEIPNVLLSTDRQLPDWINEASYRFIDAASDQVIRAPLNQFRTECLGLDEIPTGASVLSVHREQPLTSIFAMPKSAAPSSLLGDSRAAVVGFMRLPQFEPHEVIRRAEDRYGRVSKKLVYFGMGSAPPRNPRKLAESVVGAAKELGAHLVVQGEWVMPYLVGVPTSDYTIQEPIGHERLFNLLDAAIHHGGAGTLHAAVATSTPMVIEPTWFDHFYWRKWAISKGVARRVSRAGRSTPSLTRSLSHVLYSSEVQRRSAQLQSETTEVDALAAAAAIITEGTAGHA